MAGGPVIGVLSPFVGGAYYGNLLAGLGTAAALHGSRLIAVQTLDAAADMTVNAGNPAFEAPVAWDHIAGFVVLADAVTDTYLHRIEATGRPIVLLGHETGSPTCPAVLADNGSGVREAVAHLITHGHRRIAFTGYPASTDVTERLQAYREALLAHGITPQPELFLPAADNLESGITWTAADLTRAGPAPTAIVAGTDRNAIGVLRTLSAAGLDCPRDYALIGFDDTAAAPYLEPGLASVRQLLGTMAGTAVDLLLRMVAGERVAPGPHRVPTVFLPRGSCGCTDAAVILQPAVEPIGRQRLAERLGKLLPPAAAGSGGGCSAEHLDLVRHAVAAVATAIAAAIRDEPPDHAVAAAALRALYALQPQPETPRLVSRAVQEYVRDLPAADVATVRRADHCVQELILVLTRAHGRDQFAEQWRLRSTIAVHYAVSMALLYNRDTDPLDLAWLSLTRASAASVALWRAGGLELSPGWRRRPGPAIPGGSTTVSAFPPAGLIAVAEPHEVVFVVPAKVRTSDRGWLAVVDVVESGVDDGRELVNQCAALLTVAIDLREQEERLRQAALSDTLTGLPNRAAFVGTLDAAVLDGRHFAVLFLDLDGFKHVNDTYGHAAGDQLLVQVADRIRHNLRPGDLAARFGGDEFVVFVDGASERDQITGIIDRLREAIIAPFHLTGLTGTAVRIGVSIGSAVREPHRSAAEILLDADADMYRFKSRPGPAGRVRS
jgi:diguanylate cyclase (GGDEF)-like protein